MTVLLNRTFLASISACALCLGTAAPASAQAETEYRVTDLGELGYLPVSINPTDPAAQGTFGINNKGEVVFAMRVDDGPLDPIHAMLWLPEPAYNLDAGLHDLEDLFDPMAFEQPSMAREINDNGIAVGQSDSTSLMGGVGVVWDLPNRELWLVPPDGLLQPGDPVCATPFSNARSINNGATPMIVGEVGLEVYEDPCDETGSTDCVPRGYRFILPEVSEEPDLIELTPTSAPDCDHISRARDVVARIAGSSSCGGIGNVICQESDTDAVHWDPLLRLIEEPSTLSSAFGVNSSADFVGWAQDPQSQFRKTAAFWETPSQVEVDFIGRTLPPDAPDTSETIGIAINDATPPQVAGWNLSNDVAYLWTRGQSTTVQRLIDHVPECAGVFQLAQSHDINDNGWIISWGAVQVEPEVFEFHALLLTPITDCPSDIDRDGDVDTFDLLDLLGAWGDCQDGTICWSDLTLDCSVDVFDLLELLGDWGDCGSGGGSIPQTVQDCIDKIGLGDPIALEACIQAVSGELDE